MLAEPTIIESERGPYYLRCDPVLVARVREIKRRYGYWSGEGRVTDRRARVAA